MNDAEAVLELDRRRVEGCNRQDAKMMRAVLADDYIHIHTGGAADSADQYVAGATKGDRQILPRSPVIRIYGDTAIAIGPQVMKIQAASGERVLNMICTQVAHRFADGWKFVSCQATTLAT